MLRAFPFRPIFLSAVMGALSFLPTSRAQDATGSTLTVVNGGQGGGTLLNNYPGNPGDPYYAIYYNLINPGSVITIVSDPQPPQTGVLQVIGTVAFTPVPVTITPVTLTPEQGTLTLETEPKTVHIKFTSASSRPTFTPGTYFGLVHGQSADSSGYVRVVINRFGRGSVSVKLGSEKPCVLQVGGGRSIGGPIISPIQLNPPMSVQLTPIILPSGGVGLTGPISDDGQSFVVTLPAVKPSDATSSAVEGQYTVLFERDSAGSAFSADIAGMGTLSVTKKGRLSFLGVLEDGTVLLQKGRVNSDGGWSLYIKKHGKVISGDVTFSDQAATDLAGTLQVLTPESASGPEVDASLDLAGSKYDPAVEWSDAATWSIRTSDDHGATTAFYADLTANGPLLSVGLQDFSTFSSANGHAGIYLDVKTGGIVGAYGEGILDAHGLVGVAYQKAHAAFGVTKNLSTLLEKAMLSLGGGSLSAKPGKIESAIKAGIGSIKTGSTGIFAITADMPVQTTTLQTTTQILSGGGLIVLTLPDLIGFQSPTVDWQAFTGGLLTLGAGSTLATLPTYSGGLVLTGGDWNSGSASTSGGSISTSGGTTGYTGYTSTSGGSLTLTSNPGTLIIGGSSAILNAGTTNP